MSHQLPGDTGMPLYTRATAEGQEGGTQHKSFETIYHTASSSIGKLISGKQYLGRYTLEQVRDKIEAEGKELPFRKKKKLPQRSSGLAKTSGSMTEH